MAAVLALIFGWMAWGVLWKPIARHWPTFWRYATATDTESIGERSEQMGRMLREFSRDRGPRKWVEASGGWRKYGPMLVLSPSSMGGDGTLWISPVGEPGRSTPEVGFMDCSFDDMTANGFDGRCSNGTGSPDFKLGPQAGICEWKAVLQVMSPEKMEGERRLDVGESDPKCLAEYGDQPIRFEWVPLKADGR